MDVVPPVSSVAVQAPLQKMQDLVTDVKTVTVTPPEQKTYTAAEVAQHNKETDFWLIIKDEVWDMTEFQEDHPGGSKILQGSRGKDATKKFMKYHREALLGNYRDKFKVGVLEGEKKNGGSGGFFGFLKR